MTRPLVFVWPYLLIFWVPVIWAMWPEFRLVQTAKKAVKTRAADSPDDGSLKVILWGGQMASLTAFVLAFVTAQQPSHTTQVVMLVVGTAIILAASLLRRHCFRMLGKSFTGDVRAEAGQQVVTSGAYSMLRHPSYTAGIMLNAGLGIALGTWIGTAVLVIAGFAVYAYRIRVEERVLTAAIGDPYREFARTRKRLIPYIY